MTLAASALGCGGSGTTQAAPPTIPDVAVIAAGDPVCPAGGVRVRVGTDDNRDGTLSDDEVDQESSVCNGSDVVGLDDNVLVRTVTLAPGAECEAGGRRLDIGLDNGDGDGTAANEALEDGEVDTSFLDCDDVPMVVAVTPPTGAPGTFVLDTHGGAATDTSASGGSGGDVREGGSAEFYQAHLMVAATGSVDASCTAPTLTIDLGSLPAEVNADTTLSTVASGNEGTLADGDLFLRPGSSQLLIWDATNMVGEVATGLRVAAGATLTLGDNSLNGTSMQANLNFSHDVDILGAVRTTGDGMQRVRLTVRAEQIHVAASGEISTASGAAFEVGATLNLFAREDLVALGTLRSNGFDGPDGSRGGIMELTASGATYLGGVVDTSGGDGDVSTGGQGGRVFVGAETRQICNAAQVTTDGGAGPEAGGTAGAIRFGEDCLYGTSVSIRNSGALRARGGAQVGACSVTSCNAGSGGRIDFTTAGGGSIANNAALDTRGGNAPGGVAGSGGPVEFQEGFRDSAPVLAVRFEISGDITTFGGDGLMGGGSGASVVTRNSGALGSATRFLGYASARLDGGAGPAAGASAGSLRFEPNAFQMGGGVGLFVHTPVSARGGNSVTGAGGTAGDILFSPRSDGPSSISVGDAPVENVVVAANADLRGGDGASGGAGGFITASDGCGPELVATGIRVEGDIQLDGGAATVSSGGRSGGLYLGTARGAATVSGTVSAVGGASVDQGGAFDGTLILGAPAVVSATFNAGGGAGNVTGGDAEDLVIMSVVGTSSVSGTVTLTAGAGATPAQNGSGGAVRVDTGALCGGGAQPLPGR